MRIEIEVAWMLAIVLFNIRLSAALLFTPVLGLSRVPVRIHIYFLLIMSVFLVMVVEPPITHIPLTLPALALAALMELLLGLAMAFGIHTAFAAFLFGGRVIDFQMGFGIASLIDPATRQQAPLIGTFLMMLAAVIFMAIGGHHLLIRGLAYSLELFPPGQASLEFGLAPIVTQFGMIFVYGVMIAAPVFAGLMLMDFAIAVSARTMPQVNVYFVSLPLKIFVGLLLLALSLTYMTTIMETVFANIFTYWQEILGSG